MALTTEAYKDQSITLSEEENKPTELKINDQVIQFSAFANGHFHTEIFPYQEFDSLINLAKHIIDNIPNFGSGAN